MPSDPIAERYTALVAKRPECRVPGLMHRPPRYPGDVCDWTHDHYPLTNYEANALIGWHLTRTMEGTGYTLCAPCPYSSNPITAGWHIARLGINHHDPDPRFGSHPDHLSAILAFWEQQA